MLPSPVYTALLATPHTTVNNLTFAAKLSHSFIWHFFVSKTHCRFGKLGSMQKCIQDWGGETGYNTCAQETILCFDCKPFSATWQEGTIMYLSIMNHLYTSFWIISLSYISRGELTLFTLAPSWVCVCVSECVCCAVLLFFLIQIFLQKSSVLQNTMESYQLEKIEV